MKILLILGHPKPTSFNHALAEKAMATLKELGHEIVLHDLYQEHFDPVLPDGEDNLPEEKLPEFIKEHLRNFKEAGGVVIVHPNWWGGPPAILRGWVDRVLRTNSCYNFTPNGVETYVGGKIVQIFSTSNTPRDVEMNLYGDPIENFWKTVVFGIIGSQSFERRNFESIVMSTPEERQSWLAEVEAVLKRRFYHKDHTPGDHSNIR